MSHPFERPYPEWAWNTSRPRDHSLVGSALGPPLFFTQLLQHLSLPVPALTHPLSVSGTTCKILKPNMISSPRRLFSETQLSSLFSAQKLALYSAGLETWLKWSSVAPVTPTNPCTLHSAVLSTSPVSSWPLPHRKERPGAVAAHPALPPSIYQMVMCVPYSLAVVSLRTWRSNLTFLRPCTV